MCGIGGVIAPGFSRERLVEFATKMSEPIFHRGPDDVGHWFEEQSGLLLVHRRLAIQDLSPAGHQPMKSRDGRFTIVFNGEIYNFKELASELSKQGFIFRGGSDTEVMLAAFEHWGVLEAIKKFVGMFAFALYDSRTQELVLCRDRFGEKPLYFGWVDKRFVFASELKSIQAIAENSIALDKRALSSFFRFGYVPAPFSIYQNIYKLMSGSVFVIDIRRFQLDQPFSPFPDSSSVSPSKYWNLKDVVHAAKTKIITTDAEAVEQLDELLRSTIKNQCISDVPIGALLSGGVDSTTVAAVMQSVNSNPINTFTIGFKEKEFDEAPYARQIADYLKTNHHELYVSGRDGLDLIPTLSRIWDEPYADSSQIPALLVSRMAKSQVTVCLSGDGGDELFCGYNRYTDTDAVWNRIKQLPMPIRKMVASGIDGVPVNAWDRGYGFVKSLVGGPTQANFGAKLQKLAELMRTKSKDDAYRFLVSYWQNPESIAQSAECESIMERIPDPKAGSFIENAMFWDQLGYLPDDNLVKGDRSSMASSLELRLPLLDHRIAEFSWRLPLHMKCRNGTTKWALRQVLYKYVPAPMIERPKMGFSVPIKDWLRGPLREWADSLLTAEVLESSGLSASVIRSAWKEHCDGVRDHSNRLWTVLMYEAWLQGK
ncbi:MAG: asparagine synthase (glutamine-hydrolyzing) [Spongiibacteraceae bacterium]